MFPSSRQILRWSIVGRHLVTIFFLTWWKQILTWWQSLICVRIPPPQLRLQDVAFCHSPHSPTDIEIKDIDFKSLTTILEYQTPFNKLLSLRNIYLQVKKWSWVVQKLFNGQGGNQTLIPGGWKGRLVSRLQRSDCWTDYWQPSFGI